MESEASAVRAAREVRVVFGRLRRRLRELAAAEDLTPSQISVLTRLDKGGVATASRLAAAERVRPQSMAATLAVLEQHALIARRPDPADGRRQVVSLTDEGVARVQGGRRARQEWLAREFADGFTEEEREAIIHAMGLLDRLNER